MFNIGIENIEYILFLVVVILQIRFFLKTRQSIDAFKTSVPEIVDIEISVIEVSADQLDKLLNSKGLNNAQSIKTWQSAWKKTPPLIMAGDQKVEIKVVGCIKNASAVFNNILESLNKYLLHNRHTMADFQLIKDIVERNTNTIEDEVNLTLSTPLYLGLMGTMMGIVIGLFSMSHLINENISDKDLSVGIAILLGSVKVAMVGSFVGLALTIYNSAISFKGTKYTIEARKNAFYTLIQVSLLPALNQGMSASFETLQRNLSRFNEGFDSNLDRLSGVFDKNYEAILLQRDLLKELDSTKISEITRYNITVFDELKIAMAEFEKFNKLFRNVDEYLSQTYQLTDKANEMLQRTDNFETIANNIGNSVTLNAELVEFLSGHFKELKAYKEKVDETVVKVGFGISDTFDQLNKMIIAAGNELSAEAAKRNVESQKVFDSFTEDLKTAFDEQTSYFKAMIEEKKSNLDYLNNLGPLLDEVKSFKGMGNSYMPDMLYNQLVELNRMLGRVEQDISTPFYKKMIPKKWGKMGTLKIRRNEKN